MGFITLRNLAKKDKYFIVMEDNIGSGAMSYSSLINKKGTDKEYRQTFKLIKYGLSSEQIADVLEKDPRTIETWVAARRVHEVRRSKRGSPEARLRRPLRDR